MYNIYIFTNILVFCPVSKREFCISRGTKMIPMILLITQHKIDSWTWWRHQMETFSTLLAFCEGNQSVTDGFSSQRPVTRSFDVFFFFLLRLNKRLSKQSRRWWYEASSHSLWRHCDVEVPGSEWLTPALFNLLETSSLWDSARAHYIDVIMTKMASQITNLTVVYSIVYSGADEKKHIKAPRHWPLWGEFTGTGEFPAQRASNAENVSIWWCHHAIRDIRLRRSKRASIHFYWPKLNEK